MWTSSKRPLTISRISSGVSNRFKMTSIFRTFPLVICRAPLEPRPLLRLGQLRHGLGSREKPREPAVLARHEVEFLGKPETAASGQVVRRVPAARADLLAPVELPTSAVGARRKAVHHRRHPPLSLDLPPEPGPDRVRRCGRSETGHHASSPMSSRSPGSGLPEESATN